MKVWFITGSNRGLGLETARAALEAGDQVVATARKPEQIAAILQGFDSRLLTLPLDVTNNESIATAVDQAVKRFGRIDILVNNAGYGQLGPFEQVSEEAIKRQFATNVFGVFSVTRTILPLMRGQRSGVILTLSSIGGLVGFDGSSIYCATKFALEGWSESINQEIADFGIRAVLIEPGFFRTDFLDSSSVTYGDLAIPDYQRYATKRKADLDALNHQQAGDAGKFGKAMVELVASRDLPVRFAVGTDAYQVVSRRSVSLQVEADRWRHLSITTDLNQTESEQ